MWFDTNTATKDRMGGYKMTNKDQNSSLQDSPNFLSLQIFQISQDCKITESSMNPVHTVIILDKSV